jgi:hypothetical protein
MTGREWMAAVLIAIVCAGVLRMLCSNLRETHS